MTDKSLLDLINSEFNTNNNDESPTLFQNSPYFNDEDAIKLLSKKTDNISILSLNCQSLQSKFSQLEIYLKNYTQSNCPFSIICVQETWLSHSHDLSLLQLEGYNFVHKPRQCSLHGGVGIYLKDTLKFKILPIEGNPDIWDGLFLEILLNCHDNNIGLNRKLILGNIYRPPRDNIENYSTFTDEIQEILAQWSNSNTNVILTGDFNINLLKINEKEYVNNFLETLISSGMIPKITLPTRLTDHGGTLIDNFFVKMTNNFSNSTAGILYHNISDHQPYFVVLDYLKLMKTKHKYKKITLNSPQAMTSFRNEVSNMCKMDKFNQDCDPNMNYNILNDIIQTALKKHMPTKNVKFHKHRHKGSEWITAGIIRSIKFRDNMYKRIKNTQPSDPMYDTLKINLKTYNKILKTSIRSAKTTYFHSCFEKYKNDIKSTWMTIKEIINKTNKTKQYPESFLINNEEVFDYNKIVNEFNEFFTKIGPNLANSIENIRDVNCQTYLHGITANQFSFLNVDEDTVGKIIDKLKPKTSCGKDQISNKLLKYIKFEILPYITLIINQSINTGIFPMELKIAKVLPIHKKDENNNFNNYRPISILSSLSKVFERVIHDQLYNHFTQNNLFYCSQYGFRHKHSTELAALEVLDRVTCSMDKNEIPVNIYLDLSKAFDTLDHHILLLKLKYYGLHGISLRLLESYLSNRMQYVMINDCSSKLIPITTGVPQGSILGPLLFVIYSNDLVNACELFKPIVYADDTTLFTVFEASGRSRHEFENDINNELKLLDKWFKVNKLSVNKSKTKAMMFHTKQRKIDSFNIQLDGENIEFVKEFNYLGITFDCHLSWKPHINKVSKKISQTVGIMTRLKHFLPNYILLTLYNSLVLPYLNYGLLVWGTASHKLKLLQKRAIRTINNAKYNAHTEPLFKSLQLLKIGDLWKLQDLKFLYKLKNSQLPTYFQSIFIQQSDVHSYNTRNLAQYRMPQSKHLFVNNSIRFRLPDIINSCPSNIKDKIQTHSYPGYIKYVKLHFLVDYQVLCDIENCYVCQNL